MAMRQATLVLQLSDPHVDGMARAGEADDTGALLERAFERVRELAPMPDRILLSGDLARERGTAADYERLKLALSMAQAPVRLIPGNHDERANLARAFPEQPWGRDADAAAHLSWVEEVDGPGGTLRLVGLDSCSGRGVMGGFGARRQAWLRRTLEAAPETPTLLAMHHPPFATGDPKTDAMSLSPVQVEALAAILRDHSQVQRVVSGHIHKLCVGSIGGVVAMTCPATCWQFRLSPGLEGPFTVTGEASGALLHALTPGNPISTIHINFGRA
jgi:3',5'-cyclic AMP phosphodiesterase CpdA